MNLIPEANRAGARLHLTCEEAGITLRTYRRWYRDGKISADKRPDAVRPQPSNKLTESEQAKIIEVCNMPKFASLPPSQIVPTLLDDKYYCSESMTYRLLKAFGQLQHRGRSLAPEGSTLPTTYTATEPGQVFWDITYLPSTVRGQLYYLYMLEDLFSRKIVGSEMREQESGKNAAQLLEQTLIQEKCSPVGPTTLTPKKEPVKKIEKQAA